MTKNVEGKVCKINYTLWKFKMFTTLNLYEFLDTTLGLDVEKVRAIVLKNIMVIIG